MNPESTETGIIGDIYEASYRPEHWKEVLAGLAEITESKAASLIYRDNELQQANCVYVFGHSPRALLDYNDHYGQLDPSFRLAAEKVPTGTAIADHQMEPDRRELIRICGEFYADFMVPHDIHHFCGAHIINNDQQSAAVSVQRGRVAGPWANHLIQKITDLVQHFHRALHIHREFTRMRMRESALQTGLDRLLMGLVLFDEFFQPVYSNPVADSILKRNPAIRLRSDRIYAARREDTEAIRRALARALQATDDDGWEYSTALGLRHPYSTTPLPILITPVHAARLGFSWDNLNAHAALFLSDPESNQPVIGEALCKAYGLTPSEAEVSISIVNGMTLDQIAMAKGTANSTVRSQLKAVFHKLGVNRQTELVRMLLTSPFRMRL